ncbi:hypothetical protein [Acinetobacter sp. 10FS3-1]|uniref:hypothetical protein n=1 Tax=Acinetobacter sp. 10FS3-1 TaxID=2563897 RepID=UPI00157C4241|nr:hypothetical protein [Acinetobacter sp. 10FS3-1]QKQ69911.1 hypothetical protein E5Y90_06535 [Acinetobacter sp. 10FS3-1]
MSKVRVKYQDGVEEDLIEVHEEGAGVLNIFHKNRDGEFLTQHLPPYARMQVHNLQYGSYLLGSKLVEVIRYDYP